MNVLILDTKRKILPVYEYCKKMGYNTKVVFIERWEPSDSEILVSEAVELQDSIFYDFIPDQIVNFKEQEKYLKLETALNAKFGLEGDYSNPFFMFKKDFDYTCKKLNIPTPPNESDTVIQKEDWSGGTNFKVLNRKDATAFHQDYLEIDYIISINVYSSGDEWYTLGYHKNIFKDQLLTHYYRPAFPSEEDEEIIQDSVKKLHNHMKIHNKLYVWQFLKDKSGNLYSIDFNLRPSGGYHTGEYDTLVSDEFWVEYLFGKIPPKEVKYTHQIKSTYITPMQFGFGEIKRERWPIT